MPKFCNKCGNPLKDKDKFCRKCGEPVGQTVAAGHANPNPAKAVAVPSEAAAPRPDNTFAMNKNSEGTVLLEGLAGGSRAEESVAKADIVLSLDEMLRGCSKVVDFGSGKRFEIIIPAGITPGDMLVLDGSGIIDQETGLEYRIELTAVIE